MKKIPPVLEERTLSLLAECALFRSLEVQHLRPLVSEFDYFQVEGGEIFLHEGRMAGSIYLIVAGHIELFTRDSDGNIVVLSHRHPGDTVGELAIISCEPREASARAIDRAIVARFSRARLVRLSSMRPSIMVSVTEAVRHDLRQGNLDLLLNEGELFSDLSEDVRLDLIRELEWVELKAGEDFIRQGDEGNYLGVVISGRFHVLKEGEDGASNLLHDLGKGAAVGVASLFTGLPRTNTVQAARDSEIVRLSRDSFHALVSKYPLEMTQVLAGGLIERLTTTSDGQRRPDMMATLAIIPAGAGVPIDSFCSQLISAFSRLGSSQLLSSAQVDRYMEAENIAQTSPEGINNGRLVAWLNSQEHRYDYVIYQSDPQMTPWSQRCLRQADIVLIVGQGQAQATRGHLEEALLAGIGKKTDTRQVLVLIHEDDVKQPSGTAAWLKVRPDINHHYHVRKNGADDYARLSRFLAGRALGLVLSGGGARGAAHIGVLQAFEEAQITIDHIGGNSAGSVIAATYASGRLPSEIPALIKGAFKMGNFFDPTIPLYSLFSGRRGAAYYREILGDSDIEDLWLPFFCVSSNLTRAEIMVHDQGPLWRSVLASNSAPGMRPPVVHEGDLLSDGGLLDDLPMDVSREKVGSGTVIAVDVCPSVDLAENPDYGDHISGWRILWSRFNPLARPLELPSITAIMQRSNQLNSIRSQRLLENAHLADLIIRPPVDHFSMMDGGAIDEMITIAAAAASEDLAAWKSSQGNQEKAAQPDNA